MFGGARSAGPVVRTLVAINWMEMDMSKKTQGPVSAPQAGHAPTSTPPQRQPKPTEPVEVLGRHKNDGQKDHKGAR